MVQAAREKSQLSKFRCPKCRMPMSEALIHHGCRDCQLFWIEDYESDPNLKDVALLGKVDQERKLGKLIQKEAESIFSNVPSPSRLFSRIVPELLDPGEPKRFPVISILAMILVAISFIGTNIGSNPHLEVPRSIRNEPNGHVVITVLRPSDHLKYEKAYWLGIPGGDSEWDTIKALRAAFLNLTAFSFLFTLFVMWTYGREVERKSGSVLFLLLILISVNLGFSIAGRQGTPADRFLGGSAYLTAILCSYGLCFLRFRGKTVRLQYVYPWVVVLAISLTLSTVELGYPGIMARYESTPWVGALAGFLLSWFI
jgi:membrane associated rhomboid family serine protease